MGQPQGPALRGDGLLTGLGVNDGDTLFFKDLGRHIGGRLYLIYAFVPTALFHLIIRRHDFTLRFAGVQISWRLVFVLEYLGPLLIFPAFYFFPNAIYGVADPPAKCFTQT